MGIEVQIISFAIAAYGLYEFRTGYNTRHLAKEYNKMVLGKARVSHPHTRMATGIIITLFGGMALITSLM